MNKLFRPAFSCIALTIASVIWTVAPLHAQVSTWSGGSLANSNWDQSANWQSGAIPDGNTDMTFTGSLRTTNNNNFSENQISLNFLDFDSGADARQRLSIHPSGRDEHDHESFDESPNPRF